MRRFRSPTVLVSKMVIAAMLGYIGSAIAAPLTLKDAIEAAWLKQPEARSYAVRQEEMAARRDAASSLFPAAPSVGLSQRTDRYNQNRGARETEAEIAIPLWTPGTRSAAQRLAAAESGLLDTKNHTNKLSVAEQVREAYWQARLAQNDSELARRRANEAAVLMQDVERRYKAGDLARTDLNQSKGAERLARASLMEAETRALRTRQVFHALTGLLQLPESGEPLAPSEQLRQDLPKLAALTAEVQMRQARLAQVSAERREPPEVALGMVRERPGFTDGYENSVRLSVRIPLATRSRNAPRIAAANADLIEADAALAFERDRIQAEIDTTKAELSQAQNAEALAQERSELATDTHQLHAKAFQLGEIDLVTRLRTENERFEADLALSRARVEVGRTISRVNQVLGLLP